MAFGDLFRGLTISGTGLSAERLRMETIAHNIANAFSTRTPDGGPFRRQDVVFSAIQGKELGGVEVVGLQPDPSELRIVHQPGHPDADAEGNVQFPNVHLPMEMVNLITASRSYEANVRAAQLFRQMSEEALALLRG
jgi:flagellar basal-body rod protein FlgC